MLAKASRYAMFWVYFAAFAALVDAQGRMSNGGTLLRFGCSQIVIDRIDP